MAFRSMFFNSTTPDDDGYSASDFAQYFNTFISDGIFPSPGRGGLSVTNVPNTMRVKIAPGAVFIKGHMATGEGEVELPMLPGSGSGVCLVVMRLDFTTDASGNERHGSIYPAVTDVLQRSNDVWDMQLARVIVPAGQSTLNNATITDTRANPSVCGFARFMGDLEGLGAEPERALATTAEAMAGTLGEVRAWNPSMVRVAVNGVPISVGSIYSLGYGNLAPQPGDNIAVLMGKLYGKSPTIGFYTGNGDDDRTITLGTEPPYLVIVYAIPHGFSSGAVAYGGVARSGFTPTGTSAFLSIVSGASGEGFRVRNFAGSATLNGYNTRYMYMWWV